MNARAIGRARRALFGRDVLGAFAALVAFVAATTVVLPVATGIGGPVAEAVYAVGATAFTALSLPYTAVPSGALPPELRAPLFGASLLVGAWVTAAALAGLRRRLV